MPDRRIVLLVVGGLAVTLLVCVLGTIALTLHGDPVPDLLKELGVGSLGGLAGILARTNTEPGPIQPVNVVSPPATPVPVADPPGYQQDPHLADEQAKAERLAHAKRTLATGALASSTATDAAIFRNDMHDVARRAAIGPERRWPPSPGNVTGDKDSYGVPPGWKSKLPAPQIAPPAA